MEIKGQLLKLNINFVRLILWKSTYNDTEALALYSSAERLGLVELLRISSTWLGKSWTWRQIYVQGAREWEQIDSCLLFSSKVNL
jgi:hypothetical protein